MKVVIVGAGPSGLFLAHRLLNRDSNYEIQIFERKQNPRDSQYSDEREFGFGLGTKAKNWLTTVDGLWDSVIEEGVKLSFGELWLIPRRKLCSLLLNTLISRYEENISQARFKVEFNTSVLEIDFPHQKILVEQQNSRQWVSYDLLVGADGANSTIRGEIVTSNSGEMNFQREIRPQVWKVLQLGEQTALAPEYSNRLIRLEKQSGELGLHFGAILPHKKGIFNALIFWTPVDERNAINPYGVSTVQELEELLNKMLADKTPSVKLEPNLAETFLATKPSREYWSKCDRYHTLEGKVVLIGDAAHNMFSILGQGCTAALADVVVLDELLEKHQNDLSIVLPEFSEKQVEEGHAVSDLNLIALVFYHPLFRKLYKLITIIQVGVLKQSTIFGQVNRINTTYKQILAQNKIWLWLGKKLLKKQSTSSANKEKLITT